MGEFLFRRHWRHFIWQSVCAVAITIALVLSFQNCSGGGASAFVAPSGNQINGALANAGMPVQMNINEISLMTCAQAGVLPGTSSDQLGDPFYHLRFGAFNNTQYNPNNTSAPLGSFLYYQGTNIGGIGMSTSAMNFLRSTSVVPSSTLISNLLKSSPYSAQVQPVAAVIYPNGARSQALAPTFSSTAGGSGSAVATSLLLPLSSPTLSNDLANAPQTSSAGNQQISYFPDIGGSTGTLLGSLSFPVSDMSLLESTMTSSFLFLGYSTGVGASGASLIQTLEGPDGTPSGRLFGLGYQFTFTEPNPGNPTYFYLDGGFYHQASPTSPVQEFDFNPASGIQGVDLTAQNNELWDCFHLTVVRDVDRKYYTLAGASPIYLDITTGAPCTPSQTATTCVLIAASGVLPPNIISKVTVPLQTNYFASPQEVASVENTIASAYTSFGLTFPQGVQAACPREDTNQLNALQLDQLRIIRRFLSPDLWEVNISQGCVVPTAAATSTGGSCYLSTDTDSTKYIQYDTDYYCGPGKTAECPATVSFCSRFQ